MRLRVFKDLINGFTDGVYKHIPVTKATYQITKMIKELEEYFLHSAKKHPKKFYRDGNFPRLVKVCARMLIYVSERDSHYRAMITVLFMQIYTLMARENHRFGSPVEMVSELSGQEIKYEEAIT